MIYFNDTAANSIRTLVPPGKALLYKPDGDGLTFNSQFGGDTFYPSQVWKFKMKLKNAMPLTFNKFEVTIDVCISCGNGMRYGLGEACDDGNLVSGDGCNNLC